MNGDFFCEHRQKRETNGMGKALPAISRRSELVQEVRGCSLPFLLFPFINLNAFKMPHSD